MSNSPHSPLGACLKTAQPHAYSLLLMFFLNTYFVNLRVQISFHPNTSLISGK